MLNVNNSQVDLVAKEYNSLVEKMIKEGKFENQIELEEFIETLKS
jgi:hypothetical protein